MFTKSTALTLALCVAAIDAAAVLPAPAGTSSLPPAATAMAATPAGTPPAGTPPAGASPAGALPAGTPTTGVTQGQTTLLMASTATPAATPSTSSTGSGALPYPPTGTATAPGNAANTGAPVPKPKLTGVSASWNGNTAEDLHAFCEDPYFENIVLQDLVSYNFDGKFGQPELSIRVNSSAPAAMPRIEHVEGRAVESRFCEGLGPALHYPAINTTLLEPAIAKCQKNGKKVLVGLGQSGFEPKQANQTQSIDLANLIWSNYLGGGSKERAFGQTIRLDGVDLGSPKQNDTSMMDFTDQMNKNYATQNSNAYYITASSGCARTKDATDALAQKLDATWVQFYNDAKCGIDNKTGFTESLQDWSKAVASSEIFIGALASSHGAAANSYANVTTMRDTVAQTQHLNLPNLGGWMLWDATPTPLHPTYAQEVAEALSGNKTQNHPSKACEGRMSPALKDMPATSAPAQMSPTSTPGPVAPISTPAGQTPQPTPTSHTLP